MSYKREIGRVRQQVQYYGYKYHAICGISSIVHSYEMTAANVNNLHCLQDVKWQYHECVILSDKTYLCADIQQNLLDVAYITLKVPYQLNKKNWRPPICVYKDREDHK